MPGVPPPPAQHEVDLVDHPPFCMNTVLYQDHTGRDKLSFSAHVLYCTPPGNQITRQKTGSSKKIHSSRSTRLTAPPTFPGHHRPPPVLIQMASAQTPSISSALGSAAMILEDELFGGLDRGPSSCPLLLLFLFYFSILTPTPFHPSLSRSRLQDRRQVQMDPAGDQSESQVGPARTLW